MAGKKKAAEEEMTDHDQDVDEKVIITEKPIGDTRVADDDRRRGQDRDIDNDNDAGDGTDAVIDMAQPDARDDLRETPEQRRERRRQERRDANDRRRREEDRKNAAIEALETRNRDLQRQIDELRTGHNSQRKVAIDQRMTEMQTAYQQGEIELQQAIEQNNGAAAVAARRKIDAASYNYRELAALKGRIETAEQQDDGSRKTDTQQQQQQASPRQQRLQNDFLKEIDGWYDPNSGDQDSALVLTLDAQVMAEGFDPASSDYWEELRDRVREILPHRFENDGGNGRDAPRNNGARRGPPVRGGGTQMRHTATQVYINPERKAALQAAGIWGDKEKMAKMAKRYRDYDRDHQR